MRLIDAEAGAKEYRKAAAMMEKLGDKLEAEIGRQIADILESSALLPTVNAVPVPEGYAVGCNPMWIPCGVKLPERNAKVLACDTDGEVWTAFCMNSTQWIDDLNGDELHVLYWMPIPDLPEV